MLGIVIVGVGLLGYFGLVTSDNTVIAAVVAFLGVLVTAVLTFLGALIKPIIEGREQARRDVAEKRLAHEASIKAIGLLSNENAVETPPNQQSAAVAMLSSLGQVDLSLALLRQMWPQDRVLDSTAMWLINRGLMCGQEAVQNEAVDLLIENIDRAVSSSGYILWPDCAKYHHYEGRPSMHEYVRRRGLSAVMSLLLSKPYIHWEHGPLLFAFHLLHVLLRTEPSDSEIRKDTAFAIEKLLDLDIIRLGRSTTILSEPVSETAIRSAIHESLTVRGGSPSDAMAKCLTLIELWRDGTLHRLNFTPPKPGEANVIWLDNHQLSSGCLVEHYVKTRWVPGHLHWQEAGDLQLSFHDNDGNIFGIDDPRSTYCRIPNAEVKLAEHEVPAEKVAGPNTATATGASASNNEPNAVAEVVPVSEPLAEAAAKGKGTAEV